MAALTLTGSLNAGLVALRTRLATSETWQTLVGVDPEDGNAVALAAAFVHEYSTLVPTATYAIVDLADSWKWTSQDSGSGYRLQADYIVFFDLAIPPTLFTTDGFDDNDRTRLGYVSNKVGAIIDEIKAQSNVSDVRIFSISRFAGPHVGESTLRKEYSASDTDAYRDYAYITLLLECG